MKVRYLDDVEKRLYDMRNKYSCVDGKHKWVIMPEVEIHDAVCDKCGICASDFIDKEEYWQRIREIVKEAKENNVI